jgi:hypothetical protein
MNLKTLFLISLLALLFPAFLHAETATVITKENAVREYCKFFAPVKAQVKYNDSLEIVSSEGDWFKVRFRAVSGCIHKSAIQKKSTSTGSSFSRKGSGVSDSEAALAGKGFNPQVEASYKQNHPEMKYSLLDSVEKFDASITDRDIARFVKAGGLTQP